MDGTLLGRPELRAELFLALARGLTGEAALAVRRAAPREALARLDAPEIARWAGPALASARRPVRWPGCGEVQSCAERLEALSIRLAWRGEADYPERLAEGLGARAPAWALVSPPLLRPSAPACAIIGSRQTPPRLCAATRALAFELAERGCAVASGMAEGADEAAHEGAARGRGGTIGVPARGLLQLPAGFYRGRPESFGLVGLGRPDDPFSAGLAVRRNDAIAALTDGVVMAASGLRGGSAYAVRWALKRGRPVWSFECGAQTPPGNKSLLRAGLARPLSLRRKPGEWAEEVIEELARAASAEAQRGEPDSAQLDWLGRV